MGLGGTRSWGLGCSESVFAFVYVPDWVAKRSSLAPIIAVYVTSGVGLPESASNAVYVTNGVAGTISVEVPIPSM